MLGIIDSNQMSAESSTSVYGASMAIHKKLKKQSLTSHNWKLEFQKKNKILILSCWEPANSKTLQREPELSPPVVSHSYNFNCDYQKITVIIDSYFRIDTDYYFVGKNGLVYHCPLNTRYHSAEKSNSKSSQSIEEVERLVADSGTVMTWK